MNCICCMDNFDYFTHLSGMLRKMLPRQKLDDNTVVISCRGGNRLPELSLCFDSCIIISDTASGIIDIRADKSVLIMPYEAVERDPCGMKNISLITLGMSSRSTLCCSSIAPDRIMVSLQRSITNFYNEIIEPAEFCLRAPPERSQYASMALLAVKMLMCKSSVI